MDREQFLQVVTAAWHELDAAIAGLDEAALSEPGVVGQWAVKDLLGHVTSWEQQALAEIEQWQRDERITAITSEGVDSFNAAEAERRRGWTIAAIRAEHAATRERLRVAASSLPAIAWTSVVQAGGKQRTLGELVAGTLGGDGPGDHAAEHARQIRAWRAARGL